MAFGGWLMYIRFLLQQLLQKESDVTIPDYFKSPLYFFFMLFGKTIIEMIINAQERL
jgi:hypothetical protein